MKKYIKMGQNINIMINIHIKSTTRLIITEIQIFCLTKNNKKIHYIKNYI